jgi:16S rRNA (adenine1518-N6/adenine1519-N6)-dimethyltransferase
LSPLVSGGALQLFEADALSFDFMRAASALLEAGKTGPVRVVGNLPYNISSLLLVHLLQFRTLVKDQHFLLQREVVERIVADPGGSAYGRLGVLLQAFYEVAALFEVPPDAFDPPPRVQSAVIRLMPRAQPLIEDPRPLQRVLAEGFAQRRKMLRAHLLPWLVQQGVDVGSLDPTIRPERIDVATWCDLARQLPH